MDLPHVFAYSDPGSEDDAAVELARMLAELAVASPFVVSSIHGERVGREIAGAGRATPPRRADQEWAAQMGATVQDSGADAIVAIGGGRCLDVAKLAAARAGLTLITVPTQLSHDGICSPVAVVPGEDGRAESIGAAAPVAVFLSLPTLLRAPTASVVAGIGDLIANPLALRDWSLAVERGLEAHDQRAWDLSVEAYALVEGELGSDAGTLAADADFVRRLADALVLSGVAMIAAGSSRPASGGEHEISHALDELYGGRALHGAQVAFGCVVSTHLYGEDPTSLRRTLTQLGLPEKPEDLGLSPEDTAEVLAHAPQTRPGRYTILEDSGMDDDTARRAVKEIWGH